MAGRKATRQLGNEATRLSSSKPVRVESRSGRAGHAGGTGIPRRVGGAEGNRQEARGKRGRDAEKPLGRANTGGRGGGLPLRFPRARGTSGETPDATLAYCLLPLAFPPYGQANDTLFHRRTT